MANYAKAIPRDVGGSPMQGYPAPIPALATTARENCVASSLLSLNPNTTTVEISAFGGQGVAVRWISSVEGATVSPFGSVISSGLTANFDHIVPSGVIRRLVVPRETMGQMAGGQIGSVNGLYQRMAWINGGTTAASILVSQF